MPNKINKVEDPANNSNFDMKTFLDDKQNVKHDFVDDYTLEECVAERNNLQDWYQERLSKLNDRIHTLNEERKREEKPALIKSVRDALIEVGISPDKADDFVLDLLRKDIETVNFSFSDWAERNSIETIQDVFQKFGIQC